MQQLKNRLAFLRLLLVLLFCTAAVYLAWLVQKPELIQTAARQGTYTCTAGTVQTTYGAEDRTLHSRLSSVR